MKKLRVAFYVYPTAFQSPGGGEIQLLKTREYLEKLGVEVKLLDPWRDKLKDFDILHTFGSVKDSLSMIRAAKAAGIKTVLSTICWYSWLSAWWTYPDFQGRLTATMRHLAKVLMPRFPSERKEMMDLSDLLVPNSKTEAVQLERFFAQSSGKIKIIPNGVDRSFSDAKPDLFVKQYGLKDFVLCVGRIEPRKNQLGMIRALKGTGIPFVLIGEPVPHYREYGEACRREADANVHFIGALGHGDPLLKSAYAACKTFLLASWLETPGLAALEAALAGARIVITNQGATREYFGDLAAYVVPHIPASIRFSVLNMQRLPPDSQLREHVLKHYTWERVAEKTLDAYHSLFS